MPTLHFDSRSQSQTQTTLKDAIEHTWLPELPQLLKTDSEDRLRSFTELKMAQLCEEALTHQLGGICVRPEMVVMARQLLGEDAPCRLVSVAGFPEYKTAKADELKNYTLGTASTAQKCDEIQRALADGADECDVVINTKAFAAEWAQYPGQPERWTQTREEWRQLLQVTAPHSLKFILETSLWSTAQVEGLCHLACQFYA